MSGISVSGDLVYSCQQGALHFNTLAALFGRRPPLAKTLTRRQRETVCAIRNLCDNMLQLEVNDD